MADKRQAGDKVATGSSQGAATLKTVLSHAEDVLDKAGIDGYDVEARLLGEWVTGRPKVDFLVRPDEVVSAETVNSLNIALEKRLSGMPVHRVMGFREFYGLHFNLSEATLEPRPDTETLVDQALEIIAKYGKSESPLRILDLGTGTGAIAVALISKLPNAHAVGVDVAMQALETAQQNAEFNGLSDRFDILQGHWFDAVSGRFDLIVSNPPYIRSGIIGQLDAQVRNHDPLIALDGGPDGLTPYREIAAKSGGFLAPGGLVSVEIGYDQAIDVKAIFLENGFEFIELRKDLGGRDRALAFTLIAA
ncbi:MAG: peptide chain release factor N(5)-glutamine methyltransferase [Rhizobiaceae bacterium]